MLFTRRQFISTSLVLTAGSLFPFKDLLSFQEGKWVDISKNVGIFIEKGGTIAWYMDNQSSVIIDTQFPDSAAHFMNMIEKKYDKKIDVLFNTHHHQDHVGGNAYIKQFVNDHVAHEECVNYSKKVYKGTENEKNSSPAKTTFSDEFEFKTGKGIVKAKYFGKAHTAGDSIVHFENENVAHLGDLVFNNTYPFIDVKGGGSIKQWIENLDKVHKHYDKDTKFICGHASSDEKLIANLDDVKKQREYFEELLSYSKQNKSKFQNKDEFNKIQPLDKYKEFKERWPDAFKKNVEAALLEV